MRREFSVAFGDGIYGGCRMYQKTENESLVPAEGMNEAMRIL